jgi:hypothetical protein
LRQEVFKDYKSIALKNDPLVSIGEEIINEKITKQNNRK